MTVIPRFLAVLALVVAALPAVSAHGKKPNCKPSEYYYERKGYCVAKNHHKNHAVDPPRGKGCPSHWYWSDAKNCCLPYSPPHKSDPKKTPSCPQGQKWDDKGSYCHGAPSRTSSPHGNNNPHHGNNNPHHGNNNNPHHGNDNPHHGDNNPHHGNDNPHHGDNNPHHGNDYPHHGNDYHHGNDNPHHGNDNPHHGYNCPDGEFWYEPRHTCLTRGGPSRTHTPPTGSQCPQQGWHWEKDLHCCVPSRESHPPPTCPNGWYWNDGNHKCQKKSTPASPNHPDPTHRGYNFKRVEEQSVPL